MASGPLLQAADEAGDGGWAEAAPAPPPPPPPPPPSRPSPARAGLTLGVLCYVNLLNYMDRFTLASVLPEVESFFGISDSDSGLLQTAFILSYLVLAPVCGFLGDRRSRTRLLGVGLGLWSGVTLGCSFVTPQGFWALLLGRALVGVGEASYSSVAPTLIADLFSGAARSRALGGFYLAVPLGSGLGYIVGAKVKDVAADWRWALRVTPPLGLVAVVLLVTVVSDPPRGGLERPPDAPLPHTSWGTDLRILARNRSLVLSTLGVTAVTFVSGALALWAPAFLGRSRAAGGGAAPCQGGRRCHDADALLFGALTCVSGVVGVGLGAELSRRLRPLSPRADALLCGGGVLGSAPFLLLALLSAAPWPGAAYVFIFLGETLLSLNWAVSADILLYVVAPPRRATAEALQILLSHLLGDAGSPYLIGVLSDALRAGAPRSLQREAGALQRALLLCPFAAALGGAAFLAAALALPRDRRRAQREAAGLSPDDDDDDVSDDVIVPQGGRPTKVPVPHVLG